VEAILLPYLLLHGAEYKEGWKMLGFGVRTICHPIFARFLNALLFFLSVA